MREDTDRMIERLAREVKPVRPLAPPLTRAVAIVAGIAGAMALFAMLGGHPGAALALFGDGWFVAELAGSAIAGVSAVIAAVMLSVPGRSPNWVWLPVPGLALWILGGGLGCYQEVVELGYEPRSLFASRACFFFIIGAGFPSALAIYACLRRTLSVEVVRVLALSGAGAALLAATLLQFVHAHGTDPVDFGTHVVAVALMMLMGLASAGAARSA